MIKLKNNLLLPLALIASVFFLGCSSDDDNEKTEEGVTEEKIAIASFDMLSKNHTFSIIASNVYTIDSLVVCLFPSPVDYSNITPIIEFEGSTIAYRLNDGDFKPYSASAGENIDFSYPNIVDFKISNSDSSNSKVYRIIVDTEQPIVFNNSEIIIPDLAINTNYNGLEIDSWTNVGNHPIRLTLRTTEYTNVITPETSGSNIFSSTLTIEGEGNLNPTEQGYVNVFAESSVTGTYSATALFNLYFQENLGYIVYDDVSTSDYIKDIGYKQAELKIKGNVID